MHLHARGFQVRFFLNHFRHAGFPAGFLMLDHRVLKRLLFRFRQAVPAVQVHDDADIRLVEVRVQAMAQELIPFQAFDSDGGPGAGVHDALLDRRIDVGDRHLMGFGVQRTEEGPIDRVVAHLHVAQVGKAVIAEFRRVLEVDVEFHARIDPAQIFHVHVFLVQFVDDRHAAIGADRRGRRV